MNGMTGLFSLCLFLAVWIQWSEPAVADELTIDEILERNASTVGLLREISLDLSSKTILPVEAGGTPVYHLAWSRAEKRERLLSDTGRRR